MTEHRHNWERGYATHEFVTWTCYRCGERFREYYLEMKWTE